MIDLIQKYLAPAFITALIAVYALLKTKDRKIAKLQTQIIQNTDATQIAPLDALIAKEEQDVQTAKEKFEAASTNSKPTA